MRRPLAASACATVAGLLLMAGTASANEVIVRFQHGAPASARAAAWQSVGAVAGRRLLLDDTRILRVKPGSARAASRALERLDAVKWAEPNLPVEGGAAATNDPDFGDLWGLKNTGQTVEGHTGVPGVDVNALPAWDTTRGAGTVIAVVDSGVAVDHPDIEGNLWTNPGETPGNGVDDDANGFVDDVRGWDFWDSDNDPDDFHGHGSHVAGTAAATGNNNTGIVGVAPEAKVLPVRVLNEDNAGKTADNRERDRLRRSDGSGRDQPQRRLAARSRHPSTAGRARRARRGRRKGRDRGRGRDERQQEQRHRAHAHLAVQLP